MSSKIVQYFSKHPETVEMAYAEFSRLRGSPKITSAHFYKMRGRCKKSAEKFNVSGGKKEAILEFLERTMKSGGIDAVKNLSHQEFIDETNVETGKEWFDKVRRRFVRMAGENCETPPDPISIDSVLKSKISELKVLLNQLGYDSIRIVATKKVNVEL